MVQIQSSLDNCVQSNATRLQFGCGPGPVCMCTLLLDTIHIGPGPQPNCSRVALLWTLLSRALCICTTRINVSSCYKLLWTRSLHQQQTHCVLYSYFITRSSTTWRRPETCSCSQLSVPLAAIIDTVVFWLYICHICDTVIEMYWTW